MVHDLLVRAGLRSCGSGGFAPIELFFAGALSLVLLAALGTGREAGALSLADARSQDFSRDPVWESFRNRLLPDPPPTARQDFGYSASRNAGGVHPGEIGGWIQRSITPAYYARAIPTLTLNDRFSASGQFAVTKDDGGSGMLFGWFNASSRGWRTPNSMVFRIDGNGMKYWVFYEYATQHWLAGGGGCFEGEHYQTTPTKPFAADGTIHRWSMSYTPDANSGNGELRFVIDGKEYRRPLAPGHKADGAEFNRFGLLNQMTTGGGLEVYFDDLVVNGKPENFDADQGWGARGNRGRFPQRAVRPLHDFGYSPTHHAGGRASGEIGGIVWRDERPAFCADRMDRRLSLDDELSANGKLAFTAAGSDSAVYFGWFDSTSKRSKNTPQHQEPQKNLLGIVIEGPSRIGHYFRPGYATSTGAGAAKSTGPVIRPDGKAHEWTLHYSPRGAGSNGRITFGLDQQIESFDLQPGHRAQGATFDRFGLFNVQSGGHHVEVYLDDLVYTTAPR